MKLLRAKDYQTRKWKNGQGTTAEIAIFPETSSVAAENFLWRLSTANVTEDGGFSNFPGYDRYLSLMSGPGLKLKFINSARQESLEAEKVLKFSGDEKIECELLHGPVSDLNLIVRRNIFQIKFEIFKNQDSQMDFKITDAVAFFVVLSGSMAAQSSLHKNPVEINQGETLFIESAKEVISLTRVKTSTKFAFVSICNI